MRPAFFALLLAWHVGLASDVSFTGCLERAGNQSISIRLADRRVICALLRDTPQLAPTAIAARFHMGDEVEITCKQIEPVWEAGTSRYQYLEVTGVRLVKRPAGEELRVALKGRPFHEGENLVERPIPDEPTPHRLNDWTGPGSHEWAQARQINLDYAANMPNFVADETQKRYRASASNREWSNLDTVETEITFQGNHTVRREIRRNGKPWERPFEALPGFKWYGGFGSEISPIFDPSCPTTIEYQGHARYGFQTEVDGCFPFFYHHYQRYNPPRTGHVLLDAAGNVIELDEESRGFPAEFELAEREEHIYWDYVKIGDETHLLPVRATCTAAYFSGERYRIEVEFKNHRHFQASTNITFH